MTNFCNINNFTTKFITSVGVLALLAGVGMGISPPAHALDCLLDTNNNGDADSNVDTDGGANSGGAISRVACGSSASAGSGNATALGYSANAVGDFSTAVGSNASSLEDFSTAFGAEANASLNNATALGYSSSAGGQGSTSVGSSANANATHSTALGYFANANAANATAIGAFSNRSNPAGARSVALGRYAHSTGNNSIAIGADGNGNNIGAQAVGAESIVIGTDAVDSGFDNVVIVGPSVSATETGQVILKNADTFTILGNGYMGLGTASPTGNLHIDSGLSDALLVLTNSGAEWELKSKATTGRLTFGNVITGSKPLKLGAMAVNNLLNVGTIANDQVNVKGDLVVTGTLITGGPTCSGGCDAVFDVDYDLPSIEDHAKAMYAKKHLPQVGPTKPLEPINISEKIGNMLNELEKAHIYIAQQQTRLVEQEIRLAKLEQLLVK